MARASAGEVRSQLYVASDQKYISEEQFKAAYTIVEKCSRQISSFISLLENNPRQSRQVSDNDDDYMIDLQPNL
jgi:hypothetical protein